MHVAAVEYGVRTLLLPQLAALEAQGFDVRVACNPEGQGFSPELERYRPSRVEFPRRFRPLAVVAAARALHGVIRDLQPDILHLHSPAAAIASRLLPRSCVDSSMRIVYTVHGFRHQWDRRLSPFDRGFELLERLLASRTDALLFQSEEDYRESKRRRYRTRLVWIGNGVEEDWLTLEPPVRSRSGLRLLFVGRIVREKGILDLLDAVHGIGRVTLTIIGGQIASERDGVWREAQRKIAKLDLASVVTMVGPVSKPELRRQFSRHHALVLPSHREGLPRSVIESLAAGRPAIVTDIRGCRELVADGVEGFVVRAGDPAHLRSAIVKMRDLPSSWFASMADAARRRALERHMERLVFERLIRCYEGLGIIASDTDDDLADHLE